MCNSRTRGRIARAILSAVPLAAALSGTWAVAGGARAEGGATVPARADDAAFAQPLETLGFQGFLDFRQGRALFHREWEPAPGANADADGLGPLYNARSCQMCHVRDGRGPAPSGGDIPAALVFRLGLAGGDAGAMARVDGYHPAAPDPVYGWQLQGAALDGHRAEHAPSWGYEMSEVPLNGGGVVQLRRPVIGIGQPAYGPLHPQTRISARIAPQLIGLGLIEAIAPEDILANADPHDSDGDGISGRANMVRSPEHSGPVPGRFGHKAGVADLRRQTALALARDMGLSSPLFADPWGDCTQAQSSCRAAPHGDGGASGHEVDAKALDLLTHYARNLAVPARRDTRDPAVVRGERLFGDLGCSACHVPAFVTRRMRDRPEHSQLLIRPYSDFLLHDMGEGLADGLPEGRATGREWRTAPLWGLGLVRQVNPRAGFLHDGRARTILEAVLWHGGEAGPARDAVIALPPRERADLLRFLESL